MTTFTDAINAAPAEADFVAFQNIGGWIVAARRSDGIWDTCANLTTHGYAIFVAGVAANKQSLWSYESRQFICGDVGQLSSVEG